MDVFLKKTYKYDNTLAGYIITAVAACCFIFLLGNDKDFFLFPMHDDDFSASANTWMVIFVRVAVAITFAMATKRILPFNKNKLNFYEISTFIAVEAASIYIASKIPSNKLRSMCVTLWVESFCFVFIMGLATLTAATFILMNRLAASTRYVRFNVSDANVRRTRSGLIFGVYHLPETASEEEFPGHTSPRLPRRVSSTPNLLMSSSTDTNVTN